MSQKIKWWTLVAVVFAGVMTTIDNTVVNVALLPIQRDLHLTQRELEWVVNAYILPFSVLMLLGGRLADVVGCRPVFLVGQGIFTAASLAAGLSHSGTMLIAARAVQGTGAALMTPATLAIVAAVFQDHERGVPISIWASATSLAYALGPVAGGAIAEHVHWTWIFFINVPLGAAGMVLAWAVVPRSGGGARWRDVDGLGVALSGAAVLAIIYTLVEGGRMGWSSPEATALLIGGGACLLAFVVAEVRVRTPMLDLSLFRSQVFAGSSVLLLMVGFAVAGYLFFTSLYLQGVLGLSPTAAGAVFVPLALTMVAMAPAAPKLAERLGGGIAVALGMVLIAGAFWLLSRLGPHAAAPEVVLVMVIAGVGSGLTLPLNQLVMGTVPVARAGIAAGILNTIREVAGAFGIAVMGAILQAGVGPAAAGGVGPIAAFMRGYVTALVVSGGALLAAALIALVTLRGAAVVPTGPAPAPAEAEAAAGP